MSANVDKLTDERGNEYSIGERLDMPEDGTYERDQLEHRADPGGGMDSLDDAEYYRVHVMGPDGYQVTNTDVRGVLYWPSGQCGCVLESMWCYWADGDSPEDILAAWFRGDE